jgi:CrcB protein
VERLLLIAVFGSLGAVSRYGLAYAATSQLGRATVLGTLAANLIGTFLLGLLMGLSIRLFDLSPNLRTGLTVGFLGSFTTFSTLMLETVDRLEGGGAATALANLAASLIFGLLLGYAGLVLGRALAPS